MIALETPYFVLETDSSGLVLRLRRKPAEYTDVPTMEADTEIVVSLFDKLGRDRKKLLVDLRDGPRRNDPQFEDAMQRLRPRFFRGFRGAAVLVRSAVGALQVKRHMREDGFGVEVFFDEQEAIDFLRGQSVRGEVPSSVIQSRRPSQTPPDVPRVDRTSSIPSVPSSAGTRPSSPSEVPQSTPAPPTRPSRGTG